MPKITLEKLAEMIADGFADTARKSDLIVLENKLGTSIDSLETRIDSLENTIEREVNRLDIRLDQMASKFEVKDLNKRVSKIERRLKIA